MVYNVVTRTGGEDQTATSKLFFRLAAAFRVTKVPESEKILPVAPASLPPRAGVFLFQGRQFF